MLQTLVHTYMGISKISENRVLSKTSDTGAKFCVVFCYVAVTSVAHYDRLCSGFKTQFYSENVLVWIELMWEPCDWLTHPCRDPQDKLE